MSDLLTAAENAPEKPGRSKLAPHAEVIQMLRRKRWSYAEIAAFLEEKAGLKVDPSTIFDFYKRHQKKAQPPKAPLTLAEPTVQPQIKPQTGATKTSHGRAVFRPNANTKQGFDEHSLKTNDQLD